MSAIGHNSADGQLRTFIERVLRLKQEQDSIGGDIKEVYAEAKGMGFDKTAMGQLVAYLRKKDKDADKLAEQSALFDLYLEAYERPSHAHAREGTGLAGPALVQDAAQANIKPAPNSSQPTSSPTATDKAEAPTPSPETSADQFEPPAFLAKNFVQRPHCQNPDLCAGSGRNHCHACSKAAGLSEAA